MEPSIYSYSLCIALPLMLFFGFYFLLAQTPEKAIFENYLRSRRIMGMALLLLAANYSVHFFFGIRFKNVHAAILMNLSTYFLCYYLFSSALITLLDRFYITRKRIRTHIILWIIFSGLSGVVLLLFPDGIVQKSTLLALAAWLVVYGLVLSRRVIVAYRRAVRIFDDTHADDIGAYINGCPSLLIGLLSSELDADCLHFCLMNTFIYGFCHQFRFTSISTIATRIICCFTNRWKPQWKMV